MNRSPLTPTLLIAAALGVAAVAPSAALAQGGGGHRGGGGPAQGALLDEDLSLAGTLAVTAPGTTRQSTVEDDDGTTTTYTVQRGVKASGAVTDDDLQTAAGADPGDLTGALKYWTRKSSATKGSFKGTLTVKSSGGTLRLRVVGRADGANSYDARIAGAKGKGDFAGIAAGGDVSVDVTDSSVTIDVDGDYGYGSGNPGSGRGGRDCPRGQGGGEPPAEQG
jgi:hypothetical protein